MRFRRDIPEINSSSMADIAFLLLTFFLVTTSMNPEWSIQRRLPPLDEQAKQTEPVKLKEHNILCLCLDRDNRLTCNGEPLELSRLRQRAKTFIANPGNAPGLPDKVAKDIPGIGAVEVSDKHVISLQYDRETTYDAYIAVQSELTAAYNELRNELAQQKWHKEYASLSDEQRLAVRQVYPQRISEKLLNTNGGENDGKI